MTIKTKADLIRIQREARQTLKQLAKVYPETFDHNSKPIVATLAFPQAQK